MYIYIYIYIHVYINIYIHIYMYIYVEICHYSNTEYVYACVRVWGGGLVEVEPTY